MKLFEWTVETVVVQKDGCNECHSLTIETIGNAKKSAMEIAVFKTERLMKRKGIEYNRIYTCWIAVKSVHYRSKYEQYVQLKKTGKSRKGLMRLLQISFWKLNEFEKRFEKEMRLEKRRKHKSKKASKAASKREVITITR